MLRKRGNVSREKEHGWQEPCVGVRGVCTKGRPIIRFKPSPLHILSGKQQPLVFREVLYRWLEQARPRLKPQTYADYRYMIESHILPQMGRVAIDEIHTAGINAFLEEKSRSGRLDGDGGLSASYVRKLRFIIGAAIAYAAGEHYRPPLDGVIRRPPKRKREPDVLSVSEQQQLEHSMMTDMDDRKLGVLLSLYAGLRIGEVCGLCWGDIDFDRQTIHVRHTVERVKVPDADDAQKTRLVLGDTKTVASDRVIPIPPRLLPLLKERRREAGAFLLKGGAYAYLDPRTYQYSFRRYLEACEIRRINFHVLRHTFATRCVESGMDVKSLSEILGHANVSVTLNTYVHSSLEYKRHQLETMASFCSR